MRLLRLQIEVLGFEVWLDRLREEPLLLKEVRERDRPDTEGAVMEEASASAVIR